MSTELPKVTSNSDGTFTPVVELSSDIEFSSAGLAQETTLTAAVSALDDIVAAVEDTTPADVEVVGADYEWVDASQTDQVLGATGATGDILMGVILVPGTTSPGAVDIQDGAGTARRIFAGGASSVTTLHPIYVPFGPGIVSTGGAWSLTTGANVTAIALGYFT